MTTLKDIVNRLDVVWSSGGMELARLDGIGFCSLAGGSAVFVGIYNITTVSTADHGREYHCEAIINTNPPITASSSVILNHVTGMYL